MTFKSLVENSLEDVISKFGEEHDYFEYMTGDCYAFAAALFLFNKKKGSLYIATGKDQGEHAFYELQNKFYDASGVYKSKDDLISSADMDMGPDVSFKKVTYDYMSGINRADKLIHSLVSDFESY